MTTVELATHFAVEQPPLSAVEALALAQTIVALNRDRARRGLAELNPLDAREVILTGLAGLAAPDYAAYDMGGPGTGAAP
jgi:hypothetical protein